VHYFVPDDKFVTNFLDIILVIPYLLDAVVVGNLSVVCFTPHFFRKSMPIPHMQLRWQGNAFCTANVNPTWQSAGETSWC